MLNPSVERELTEGQLWDTALIGAVCPPAPVDVWTMPHCPALPNRDVKPVIDRPLSGSSRFTGR